MPFEFVLVNDRNKHEKIKNHLRQRQLALRRNKLKEWKQGNIALGSSSIVANGPLAFRHKDFIEDTSEASRSHSIISVTPSASANRDFRPVPVARIAITRSAKTPPNDLQASNNLVKPSHPLSVAGSMRSDPFRSYPIDGCREVDELFDFYTHELGPNLFQYTSNDTHDIFRHHASISLSDPAAFHAIMLMAAINRDRLVGRSLPGLRALYHRVEAIRLINERLDSKDPEVYLSES